jgi:hypothetical protein
VLVLDWREKAMTEAAAIIPAPVTTKRARKHSPSRTSRR